MRRVQLESQVLLVRRVLLVQQGPQVLREPQARRVLLGRQAQRMLLEQPRQVRQE